MEPIITPRTKYFCTKGYIISTGTLATTIRENLSSSRSPWARLVVDHVAGQLQVDVVGDQDLAQHDLQREQAVVVEVDKALKNAFQWPTV